MVVRSKSTCVGVAPVFEAVFAVMCARSPCGPDSERLNFKTIDFRCPEWWDPWVTTIAPSTKEQIVLAAESLVAQRGVEGGSVRQMGGGAGNGNNSAVQYHFGTKERLVQGVFEYRLPRLRERRDLLLAERRPDDLRAWVECEARWMFEQSELDDSNYM